jgi:hypothetical protein
VTMTQSQPQAPPPGALFDVPGVGSQTQWFDDLYETTQGLAVTWNQGSQANVNGIQQFKQTDVVTDWLLEVGINYSFVAATGQTLTPSPYAPFNFIGSFLLNIQNQYNSLNAQQSGVDIYIFNLLRPTFKNTAQNVIDSAPSGGFAGSTALGYPSTAIAQSILAKTAGGGPAQFPSAPITAATAAGNVNLYLRIPASQVFDLYYNLIGEPGANTAAWDGTPPHQAYVSPQYMAGTSRVITPQVVLAPLISTQADQSPYVKASADTTSTATASGSLTFKRRGVYATNSPLTSPAPYNWQYAQVTTKFGIGATNLATIQIPQNTGQVMSAFFRLFDPNANAPINLQNITNIQFQFGSGLNRFNGSAIEWQEWWFRSGHRVLLPPGVFAFDFTLDEHGTVNNKRCPNTLTTTGILCQITFSAVQSAQSYCVLGTESLVLVA